MIHMRPTIPLANNAIQKKIYSSIRGCATLDLKFANVHYNWAAFADGNDTIIGVTGMYLNKACAAITLIRDWSALSYSFVTPNGVTKPQWR